ncbi:TPA: hypothetical protein ACX6SD_003790 [Photobacterium damselae]
MYSPIILFVYSRLDHTKKTIEALQCNLLSNESDLIIYSDAGKDKSAQIQVNSVREYLSNIDGFKSISLINRDENFGLAKNISEGVTEVINKYGRAIVLEDDIVTSPYFLKFMNNALDKYQDNSDVWHISGWNYPIDSYGLPPTFFWSVMNCWGWGTWKDKWNKFEKNPTRMVSSWDKNKIKRFNLNGTFDFWDQVKRNNSGSLNTWAVFWYSTIFEHKGLCLNPSKTLVHNIGNDGSGENCKSFDIYKSDLSSTLPELSNDITVNELAVMRIQEFSKKVKGTIIERVIRKIRRIYEN